MKRRLAQRARTKPRRTRWQKELAFPSLRLVERLRLTPAVGALEHAARSRYGETFAGIWREYGTGVGRIKLAFTNGAQQKVADLARDFVEPDLIDAVDAERTMADVEAVREAVGNDLAYWQSQGLKIVSIGSDIQANRARVSVEEWQEPAIEEMRQRYGPDNLTIDVTAPVQAVSDTCERDWCFTERLRAGLWVGSS